MLGPVANSSARGLVCLLLAGVASANVDLVTVEAPQTDVWVGQKASFYVNLRSKGPFAGAASFSLPQIPRVVIVHVGNPTVSTEDIGEDSWYVQTHEFALFSQAAGKIQVPAFEVRFGGREEVSGPPVDRVEKSRPLKFEVKNPPGREGDAFIVTTEKIDVQEEWDPQPGAAKQGAVFHRTISQSADQVTGMALAPPPEKTPAGIRAYFASPEVSDKTDRGDFSGARTDVITYVLERPGKATLPAIKYVWWDPKSERFGSTTLPAATFEVAAAPTVPPAAKPQQLNRGALALVAALAVAAGLAAWQWSRLRWLLGEARRRLNPPDRVASRHLLRACRDNDAAAAEQAWIAWQNTQDAAYRPSTELNRAAVNLARRLYGATGEPPWDGEALASAFRNEKATRSVSRLRRSTTLAPLNPR